MSVLSVYCLDDSTDNDDDVEEKTTSDHDTAEISGVGGPALESIEVVEPSTETSVGLSQQQLQIWNDLLPDETSAESWSTFRQLLDSHLVSESLHGGFLNIIINLSVVCICT